MKPSENCAKVLHENGLCRKEKVKTLGLLIATHSGCDELLKALERLCKAPCDVHTRPESVRRNRARGLAHDVVAKWKDA